MKKIIVIIVIILLLLTGVIGFYFYNAFMSPNTNFEEDAVTIQIPTSSTYQSLSDLLLDNKIITDQSSFHTTAKFMKYDQAKIKSGQYQIFKNWNNRKIIQSLRSGKQLPVKMSFNNVRTISSLAGRLAIYIEPDSLALIEYFTDEDILNQYQVNKANILNLFIPNTYEVYWNTTPSALLKKMNQEKNKFWKSKNRLDKAAKIGLSTAEIYTLASIVEKETLVNSEKDRIAGVYLNRLRRGIALQADPTVVFAHKKFDLKRVLLKHLEIDSRYNTYKYPGLPPGPIYMPSISSIDAVLQPEKHKYLYFCAKPDGSGQHAFATNLRAHNNNAIRYQRWLSKHNFR